MSVKRRVFPETFKRKTVRAREAPPLNVAFPEPRQGQQMALRGLRRFNGAKKVLYTPYGHWVFVSEYSL